MYGLYNRVERSGAWCHTYLQGVDPTYESVYSWIYSVENASSLSAPKEPRLRRPACKLDKRQISLIASIENVTE